MDRPMTSHARRSTAGGAVLALLVTACSTASGSLGPPPTAPPGGAVIVAHDLAFDRTPVEARAGAPFQLLFDNRDSAPHNVTILDANGASTFVGETFGGPASRIYAIPALAAGTYRFRCDVHRDMTGSLVAG
jgi:plastocyanin